MNNLKLFDFFKDTLIMLAGNEANIKDRSTKYELGKEAIIKNYLDKLEGDVYTFLQKSNLEQLGNDNLISDKIGQLALLLREAVQTLPKQSWTVKAYQEDIEWKKIQLSAQAILDIL